MKIKSECLVFSLSKVQFCLPTTNLKFFCLYKNKRPHNKNYFRLLNLMGQPNLRGRITAYNILVSTYYCVTNCQKLRKIALFTYKIVHSLNSGRVNFRLTFFS